MRRLASTVLRAGAHGQNRRHAAGATVVDDVHAGTLVAGPGATVRRHW
ncbi:MAG TPA: hypothetical protein VFN19_00955 [Candidatus Nanopelagicales bacterium]|nr:hypothetical protein [Candidatus Nanopelagicales bacterium]